jgi:tetratricopeptide (TPR) repeat protein
VDLARHYVTLGQTEKAEQAILRALQTHPDNRFILRAAARFFAHTGDFDRARYYLHRSPRTKIDPWLIATDIAVADAAGKTSRVATIGRALLKQGNLHPSQLTEVASALATLELDSGKTRQARQLFEQSLSAPNDNAIAQAEWATSKLGALQIDVKLLASPLSYEARALDAFSNAEWKNVMHETKEWLDDEPFSSRPVLLGSFVAAVALDQHNESARIVRQGLRANPNHFGLRNNLVFALACAGHLDEAQAEFLDISMQDAAQHERIALIATSGLIEFRLGRAEAGRVAYEKALALARASKDQDRITSLFAFWAREEVLSKTDSAPKILSQATEAIRRNKHRPGIDALEKMLSRYLDPKPKIRQK